MNRWPASGNRRRTSFGLLAPEETRRTVTDRGWLESETRELEERLPSPAVWAKRLAGIAVGGGASGAVLWFAVGRIRRRREAKAKGGQLQAVVQVLPESWGDALSDAMEAGRWKQWAGVGAAAWLAFRLAELSATPADESGARRPAVGPRGLKARSAMASAGPLASRAGLSSRRTLT